MLNSFRHEGAAESLIRSSGALRKRADAARDADGSLDHDVDEAAIDQNIISVSAVQQLRVARDVLQAEAATLADLSRRLDVRFCEAVELIAAMTGDVLVAGLGKAGNIGQKLAATFRSIGCRAHCVHPTDAMHGDLGCLQSGDVLLALSNSGETAELCELAEVVAARGVSVIAITAHAHSRLSQSAHVVLELGRIPEAGLHGLPPTCSTTAMLALGDALALVVAEVRSVSPQDFARHHPGGSLGRRLTSVVEIMRQGDAVRIAPADHTIRDVYTSLSRPGRRPGAVMLVDGNGLLVGLFTDSDLARLLEHRQDAQLDRPISEVMTVRPITVSHDALLEEVVQLLSARRLSELPVVDEQGRPLGLVDITDVIAWLPAEPSDHPVSGNTTT